MSLLTDVDIKKALRNKEIIIEPFDKNKNGLTPIGYDFTVGDFVYCIDCRRLLVPKNNCYVLCKEHTFRILTNEYLYVSERIAGTFHSKVSLVSIGLSHISTTLDPKWHGRLLITTTNNTKTLIPLEVGQGFVTLVLFKVLTPTPTKHGKDPSRIDILKRDLEKQTVDYIKKINSGLDDPVARDEFERKVKEAENKMLPHVLAAARGIRWKELGKSVVFWAFTLVIVLAIIGTIFLPRYLNTIQTAYGGDLTIFFSSIAAVVSLATLLYTVAKKK